MKISIFFLLIFYVFISLDLHGEATPGIVNEWGYPAVGLTNKIYIDISAGYQFSLALTTNGTIVGWGRNNYGQASPPSENDFAAISAGNYHGLALKNNGSIVAWGGQQQDIAEGLTNCPAGTNFIAISAGGKFNLALKNDHSIVAWGNNDQGQITNVPAGYNFKAIAAGFAHAVALKFDGSVVVWGGFPEDYDALTNIPPGNDFIVIDAGGSHCVAIHSDGSPVAWGNDDFGQTDVPSTDPLFSLAAGESHNVGIRLDGTLVAWGANFSGQTNCPQGNTYTKTAAGSENSLAINYSGLSAQILADRTLGLYTLPVQFLAGTSGTNAINIFYQWDFQDDGIIDVEGWGINSPTNFYTNGVYSVRLSVSNRQNDTAYNFRKDYITVLNQGVGADFAANALTGVVPFIVHFSDLSSNAPQYWLWDFDNNDSIDSAEPNPTFSYSSTGSYSVSLLVSNNFGTGSGASFDSITKENFIVVVPAVTANFSADKTKVAIGENINFSDSSINNPNFWQWDFNSDGSIDSTEQNPTYSYSESGYKSVTLICGNEFSVSTNTQLNLITVTTTNHSLYVSLSGSNSPPFNSWQTAATNIQDAINISLPGSDILITGGVYSSKGYIGCEWTNVFVANSARKFTGCGNVVIDGKNIARGCYVVSSELYRIKFINGLARDNGGNVCADNSSLISCIIVDGAAVYGGGLFLTNNSEIYNCTIADNSASEIGGGCFVAGQNQIWNSIIFDNYAPNGSNFFFSSDVNLSFSCTLPEPASGGTANIYENPLLIADYKIADSSPCVDMGFAFTWLYTQKDYFGNERVFSDSVDIGAYETDVPEPAAFSIITLLFTLIFCSKNFNLFSSNK